MTVSKRPVRLSRAISIRVVPLCFAIRPAFFAALFAMASSCSTECDFVQHSHGRTLFQVCPQMGFRAQTELPDDWAWFTRLRRLAASWYLESLVADTTVIPSVARDLLR
ncbi:MAG TPA: hypothetical protein VJR58_16755, partial [Vineibacter sp.]|nr:hypothetical protein [Vineibacter sp.]